MLWIYLCQQSPLLMMTNPTCIQSVNDSKYISSPLSISQVLKSANMTSSIQLPLSKRKKN